MSTPSVSIVVPAYNEEKVLRETLAGLVDWLDQTGLGWEVIVVDDGSTDGTSRVISECAKQTPSLRAIDLGSNRGKGAAVRAGVVEATGDVVGFIDADLPYQLANLGEAIAMVHSAATDIAIGARDLPGSSHDASYPLLRRISGRVFAWIVQLFLVRGLADTQCGLKVFSREAAQFLFRQSLIDGFGFDFEVLYLARKYGFRIRRLPVTLTHRHESKVDVVRDSIRMLRDLMRVRLTDRHLGYRAARPCPVCSSIETWTKTQIEDRVVRECRRCKCRFLAEPPTSDELERLYSSDYFGSADSLDHGYGDSDREADLATAGRRVSALRGLLPLGASVLEIGCGLGDFGEAASAEFTYQGIDLSAEAVKVSRTRGLDVIRANLETFVSTSGAYDGLVAFHIFEHLLDPHMALERMRKLLKPGGHLLLVTPDTESLLSTISGDNWVSYKFPEHVILYSRSALLELIEQAGFEILRARSDYEYHCHEFVLSRVSQISPFLARVGGALFRLLPEPLPVTSGSVMITARRTTSGRLISARTAPVATEQAR